MNGSPPINFREPPYQHNPKLLIPGRGSSQDPTVGHRELGGIYQGLIDGCALYETFLETNVEKALCEWILADKFPPRCTASTSREHKPCLYPAPFHPTLPCVKAPFVWTADPAFFAPREPRLKASCSPIVWVDLRRSC